MAEGADSGQEKSFEPTPHKLQQARQKGEVVQSRDLNGLGLYLGLLVALLALGGMMVRDIAETLQPLLAQPEQLALGHSYDSTKRLVGRVFAEIGVALMPLMILMILGVVLSLAVQRCVVVAPERITPKLNKISLISNAKQKFGPKGLVEFAKGLTKIAAISAVVWLVIKNDAGNVAAFARLSPNMLMQPLYDDAMTLLFAIIAVSAIIAAADYVWQYVEFMNQQRMTQQEVKDENKSTEGDPHLKQQRRERAVEIATDRMLLDVPKADVVITNPTHYAVALRWDRGRTGAAPECVAKGVDEVARRIRESAAEHAVELVEDKPLARSLYAMVEIGEEIKEEHYRAVAAVLRYADQQRRKKRLTPILPDSAA